MCREEGEAEAWVILQLEETSVITDIDIGNQGAAFIEVQVRPRLLEDALTTGNVRALDPRSFIGFCV